MDETWVLLDANTGLHVSWYFWLRVLDEVNRSTRYGTPFGLLFLEAEVDPGCPAKLLDEAASYVPAAIRSTDLGGVLGRGRAGVLLTHQTAESAERARDRVLDRLDEACPKGIVWLDELYLHPENGAEISNLLTSGWKEREAPPEGQPARRRAS
jgi:GGDEF domain-containing protein